MKSAIQIAFGVVVSLAIIAVIITIIHVTTTTNYEDRNRCETATTPYSLTVEKRDEDFVISWYVPSANTECNVTYLLQYNIEGGREFRVNVTEDNYKLENLNLDACATLQLELWAISETGNITEFSVTRNYIVDISYGYFTDPQFTEVAEGLLVTWSKPVELTTCNVRYNFSMIAELGSFTTVRDTESGIVPCDIYCFRISIELEAMVGNYVRANIFRIYSERNAIEGIQSRVSPDDPTELIITWNHHPKEELCFIIYEVDFVTEGMKDQFLSVTTPEAWFKFIDCVESVVYIITFGLNQTTDGSRVKENLLECGGMK